MVSFRHPLLRAISFAIAASLCAWCVPGLAPAAPAPTSLSDAQSQASAARTKLDAMRASLASGVSAYSSASKDLSATQGQIQSGNKQLAKVQASLRAGQTSLDTQAAFLYRTDGAGFVDVLLGSKSFEEFASRLSVLQIIASKDAGLVENLKTDRREQQRLIAALREREARQKKLVVKVAAQRDSVQSSLNDQEGYYASLSAQVASLVNAQEKAAAAAAAARAAAARGNSSSSGSVSAPAPRKSAPRSGSVSLREVTVTGRGSNWWAMSSDSSSFSPTGVKFSGGASEYSVADNGTGTSSGRPLNDSELTCAHRSLPFGTRIAVTHGSHHIIVVVTDRGPFTSGRVLDFTPKGASLLGIDGVGSVTCEVVEPN